MTKLVVGSDLKPNPERLLEMLEKFDNHQAVEIRKQFVRGVLTDKHVQALVEHRNPFEMQLPRRAFTPLEQIIADCEQALKRRGIKEEIPPLPVAVTEERLGFWAQYNMRPVYLPLLDLTEGRVGIHKWVKPNHWFYQSIGEGKIKPYDGISPTVLQGRWYLADFSVGADYTDGTQIFPNDPFAPIISRLREERKVGKYDQTPMGSRFAITNDEWQDVVCPAIAIGLGFDSARVRLERAIEFNAIGNLYDPNRGKFNIWEWFLDPFEDSHRLRGGLRGSGGLASVFCFDRGNRGDFFAGRPLVSFA